MIRSKRFIFLALAVFATLSFLFLGPYKAQLPNAASVIREGQHALSGGNSQALLTGHAIAPKLGNATAKYVHVSRMVTRALQLTRCEQGRARPRSMEAHAHNVRPIPGETDR